MSSCLLNNHYSVLMSVYQRENAEHLCAAMNSIWEQTVGTDDFVLVCDGPLTPALDAVIEKMETANGGALRVVRLETNSGLGKALNTGIRYCRNELVARMDSDDISCPDRCENQLRIFREHPEVSIVSGTVEEFTTCTADAVSRRQLPEKQEEILAFAKKRNPFNHPCVMYKKSAVEAAGGYQDFYLLEDYYLWVRMLQKGFAGYNIPQTLLWMRAGSDMYRRRGGWEYAKSQERLFRYMRDSGFIGKTQYVENAIVRTIASLIPNRVRSIAYRHLLRK